MALTPQNNDAFFREVDENLRSDQMLSAARRWGPIVGGLVLLALLALAGFLWWRSHQTQVLGQSSEALSPLLDTLEHGSPLTDPAPASKLVADGNAGYRAAARFALADSTLAKGDQVAAVSTLNAIAGDATVPQAQRDLALLRAVQLDFDKLAPQAVIDKLKPLAVPGNAYFPSAAELTALAWLKLGRKDKAGPLFGAIVRDPNVPASLRGRANGMATTLGQTIAPPTSGPAVAPAS